MTATETSLNSALPCIDCGYDLRGMVAGQSCPECGALVERSMRGDRLCFANPKWLGKVKWGVGMVGVSAAVGILQVGMQIMLPDYTVALYSVMYVNAIGAAIALAAGYWLLGVVEPYRQSSACRIGLSILLRGAAAGTVLISVMIINIGMIDSVISPDFVSVVQLLYVALNLAGLIAALVILQGMANRIPEKSMYLLAIVLGVLSTVSSLLFATMILGDVTGADYDDLIEAPAYFAYWVKEPLLVVYCGFVVRILHHQHRLARQLALSDA